MVTFTWHACNLYKVYQLHRRFILLVLLGGGGGGVNYLIFFDWFWFGLLFDVVLFCCCCCFIRRVYARFASLNPAAVLLDKHAKLPFSKTMELPELRVFINSLQLRHCCLSLFVTSVFLSPHFRSKGNGRCTHIINGITHRERKVYCVFLPVFPYVMFSSVVT